MYTLVIIDMQPNFKAANNPRCVANCVREVKKAIEIGANIIVLEYAQRRNENGHKTKYPIRKLVQAYEKGYFITKDDDDGSYAIIDTGIFDSEEHFRLCGVNLGACVSSTARGLRENFPSAQIEVVKDAVHQPVAWTKDYYGCMNSVWVPNNILEQLYNDWDIIPV